MSGVRKPATTNGGPSGDVRLARMNLSEITQNPANLQRRPGAASARIGIPAKVLFDENLTNIARAGRAWASGRCHCEGAGSTSPDCA